MNHKTFGKRIFPIALFLPVFIIGSCDPNAFKGEILTGNRDLVVDVDNIIFNAPNSPDEWKQGPGVTKLVFTITLKDGTGDVVNEMLPGDVDPAHDYTQVKIAVSGRLVRIDALAYINETVLYSALLEDKSEYDSFFGWQIYANVRKFKLTIVKDTLDWSDGFLKLEIAPLGGNNVKFLSDSGITAAAVTDWGGPPIQTRQIAIEPVLHENPADMTFDIYTLVVDSDLREKYLQAPDNPEANYEYYPWEDIWTYREITESGKRIGDSEYKPEKYNTGGPLTVIEPQGAGAGYNSFLIDLSAKVPDPLGKYLLVAIILKYDILSVPSAMHIIEIR